MVYVYHPANLRPSPAYLGEHVLRERDVELTAAANTRALAQNILWSVGAYNQSLALRRACESSRTYDYQTRFRAVCAISLEPMSAPRKHPPKHFDSQPAPYLIVGDADTGHVARPPLAAPAAAVKDSKRQA